MNSSLALVRTPADRLRQLADAANKAHRDGIRAAIVAGQALIEAKKLVPHGQWLRWIAKHCEFSVSSAEIYMRAARHSDQAPNSLRDVLRALKKPGRFAYCLADEEWYSPKAIVEAARRVLGTIDLDPASCEAANKVVWARKIYTIREDGLKQPWRGRVFMNPPYSSAKISLFIERLISHAKDGKVTEAVVVVSSETEVKWFQNLSAIASAICFPAKRVRFWKPGKSAGGPPMGTALVYVGRRPKKFGRAFRRFGHVWFA